MYHIFSLRHEKVHRFLECANEVIGILIQIIVKIIKYVKYHYEEEEQQRKQVQDK